MGRARLRARIDSPLQIGGKGETEKKGELDKEDHLGRRARGRRPEMGVHCHEEKIMVACTKSLRGCCV